MELSDLTKKQRQALMRHMSLHVEHASWQYAAWAKYALKLEMTFQDCDELFMEGCRSQEICLNMS